MRKFDNDIINWPEFIAFAERLGIVKVKHLQFLRIEMDVHTGVKVDQTYIPEGALKESNKVPCPQIVHN